MRIELDYPCYPTTYGTGPFHPAFQANGKVYYWPNITFAEEDKALRRANDSLLDVKQAMFEITKDWNVWAVV